MQDARRWTGKEMRRDRCMGKDGWPRLFHARFTVESVVAEYKYNIGWTDYIIDMR